MASKEFLNSMYIFRSQVSRGFKGNEQTLRFSLRGLTGKIRDKVEKQLRAFWDL